MHLVDRPRALAEVARILAPAGRLVIATEDPAHFDDVWFARWFPSVPELERRRFPDEATLRAELAAAGLADVADRAALPGPHDLARAGARHHPLEGVLDVRAAPADEYAEGLARAEAEQFESLDYRFHWLVASPGRPHRGS